MRDTMILVSILLLLVSSGCEKKDGEARSEYGDRHYEVPKGDPDFPALNPECWIVDLAGVMNDSVKKELHENLVSDMYHKKLCQVVVLLMNNVHNPEKYANAYGRWAGLGEEGRSTQGGQNGLVFLIRPDADEGRISWAIGSGLPHFTANDAYDVAISAREAVYQNNYNLGVRILLEETRRVLESKNVLRR
jgi:uncharacterized membrane protein YgcG